MELALGCLRYCGLGIWCTASRHQRRFTDRLSPSHVLGSFLLLLIHSSDGGKPMPNKSLQPLELVGNERKEFGCVVCTRKSRHGGTEDAGASDPTEPYD